MPEAVHQGEAVAPLAANQDIRPEKAGQAAQGVAQGRLQQAEDRHGGAEGTEPHGDCIRKRHRVGQPRAGGEQKEFDGTERCGGDKLGAGGDFGGVIEPAPRQGAGQGGQIQKRNQPPPPETPKIGEVLPQCSHVTAP